MWILSPAQLWKMCRLIRHGPLYHKRQGYRFHWSSLTKLSIWLPASHASRCIHLTMFWAIVVILRSRHNIHFLLADINCACTVSKWKWFVSNKWTTLVLFALILMDIFFRNNYELIIYLHGVLYVNVRGYFKIHLSHISWKEDYFPLLTKMYYLKFTGRETDQSNTANKDDL